MSGWEHRHTSLANRLPHPMRFTKRSHCVDADLARLYGVPTKRLNEQVNRSLLIVVLDDRQAVLRRRIRGHINSRTSVMSQK
jgi:hypothetical protein